LRKKRDTERQGEGRMERERGGRKKEREGGR
jgi:hypothetical protein